MESKGKEKKLIVVAGIYGAGKSTFIQNQLQPIYGNKVHYLLPDQLVQKYGYQQGTPTFHHQIIEPMIRSYLMAGTSLLYETTLTSTSDQIEMPGDAIGLNDFLDQMPSDLDRMGLAREQGYNEIILYYLSLGSPEKHAQFVHERESLGGAAIEYQYIENRFRKSLRNLPEAIQLADQTVLIDNSNKDFRQVCILRNGKVDDLENPLPCFLNAIKSAQNQSPQGKLRSVVSDDLVDPPIVHEQEETKNVFPEEWENE